MIAALTAPADVAEVWRPVVGYEGIYSVSDLGRVRRDAVGKGTGPGRLMTIQRQKRQSRVILKAAGRRAQVVQVNRVMVAAFVRPPAADELVVPADGDWSNLRLDNWRIINPERRRGAALTATGELALVALPRLRPKPATPPPVRIDTRPYDPRDPNPNWGGSYHGYQMWLEDQRARGARL